MSQVNFFLSDNEVRTLLLKLVETNEVLIFNGCFFDVEFPEPVNSINDLSDSKELTFWLKNDFVQPKCSGLAGGERAGKFLFDYYNDPIIEFENCIWTEKLISPGRIFYKAGWIQNEELRKLHINWTSRVAKLFTKGLKKLDTPWRISVSIENWVLQGGLVELGKGGKVVGKENINGV